MRYDREALLVYDGDCGFCSTSANWAARRFRHGERAEPWQWIDGDDLERLGLSADDVRSAAWWIDRDGRRHRGHRAVGRALRAGGGFRAALGWVILTPPTSWLASVGYRMVARWRYRLPGGTPACRTGSGSPGT